MSYYGVGAFPDAIVDASLASSATGQKILVARMIMQYIVLILFIALIIYAIAKGGKKAAEPQAAAKSAIVKPADKFCCGY